MNLMPNGCRLCLDPFAERFTTIDSPVLKAQMEKVFCFSIEPKQGYRSDVCQSCSHTISEFYQYSEKVRQNQEVLYGNFTNWDLTLDSKISTVSVKHEPPEKTDCELGDQVLGEEEEVLISGSNITLQSSKVKTLNDSALLKNTEDDYELGDQAMGDEDVPKLNSEISLEIVKIEMLSDSEPPEKAENDCEPEEQVLRLEEGSISGSRITLQRVKFETLNDFELPDNVDDDCEAEDQAIANIDGPILDSEIFLEDVKIETFSDSELPETTEQIIKKKQDLVEEDQLFKKHLRMVCDLCGLSADSFPALRSHFKNVHKRHHGYVVCCNKKLFQRWAIREHIEFHANPEVFRCQECGMTFKSTTILNTHMIKRHLNDDLHPFKCDQCPHSFTEKSALAEHMARHMKARCPKCKKLIIKSYLKYHMCKIHSDKERTMICETCGKEFLTKEYFVQHMKTHQGIEIQKVQCDICQRWLKGEKSLRNHIKMLHTTVAYSSWVQCDLCPKKYKNSRLLYTHKQWTHAEPKYECEFCGKKYKVACRLKDHRATHTGEFVTCKYCGITKCNKHYLYKHIKQHHPEELAQRKVTESSSVIPNKK